MAPSARASSGTGNKKNNGTKQMNLFTFFNRKPPQQPSAIAKKSAAAPSAAACAASAAIGVASDGKFDNSEKQTKNSKPLARSNNAELLAKVRIGCRVGVYWEQDEEYYNATVADKKDKSNNVFLKYDDGDTEWLDLTSEKFRILPADRNKRRRIDDNDGDESDEEMEFEMDDNDEDDKDDDGSDYVQDAKADEQEEEDGDDDDHFIASEDEDDQQIAQRNNKTKKRLKKRKAKDAPLKVIEHKATTTTTSSATSDVAVTNKYITPPLDTFRADHKQIEILRDKTAAEVDAQTSKFALPTPLASVKKTASAFLPDTKKTNAAIPLAASAGAAGTAIAGAPVAASGKAPAYTKGGVVNPAGSHVHNHLAFVQNPRDASGKTPGDPDYDPRTLQVVPSQWKKHCGEMTNAVKQWWDLKARYFDTVLLFKTGKFYEMHHMDADVGAQVLGLEYMKGHTAHAGFPETSYGSMADRLVRAGYKVARIEQTETPKMLEQRRKKHTGKRGTAPKVVNREVCSILTAGTRTFCYLDDTRGLMDDDTNSGGGGLGPLLAIREVLCHSGGVSSSSRPSQREGEEDAVQPACEFGVTLVDAARGTVTIGQFADDELRSRLNTLLAAFVPSEILLEGGAQGASETLQSLIRSVETTSGRPIRVDKVRREEYFPKSTAVDASVRRQLERETTKVHPWDVQETLRELHRRRYYPRASKREEDRFNVGRWPSVLKMAVEGKAELALSSFGAVLFYLQRSLIDAEILSMGIVKAYVPPASSTAQSNAAETGISQIAAEHHRKEAAVDEETVRPPSANGTAIEESISSQPVDLSQAESLNMEADTNHMSLDGTTLHNLEILTNSVDYKVAGSLWSKINHTKTPHGSRLLRAWLLRPLFRKADIERRADAVQDLVSGAAAVALSEANSILAKCGDMERLLCRVHSMSGQTARADEDDDERQERVHPNNRAVLYNGEIYTKRKVGDFSKLLRGLQLATRIPELFQGIEIQSGFLKKVVRHSGEGGCFPVMTEELDWFFNNFDCDEAAKGVFEPSEGMDDVYDRACQTVATIEAELHAYKEQMCAVLSPRHVARSSWKYSGVKPESKDKYLIELPVSVSVPDDFFMVGKRGSGNKQINKYRTPVVSRLVQELERAFEVQKERKSLCMELIFAKFDSMRSLWEAAAQTTAILDALGSLAQASSKVGYTRPRILDCPLYGSPSIRVTEGRHPCVENSIGASEFVPNDLSLGSCNKDDNAASSRSRVLLLSGPNMGGKSTLLRQTCLIAIMAQIGCYVPAKDCQLTPVDRIYTRLGASDRLLLGQSTFFVELAETAAALRGATRRSLVIMDELGRGTSTFDGTAIASATVQHLVERSKCLSLFATHYHSLLEEWKHNPDVRLGHMECIVENGKVTSRSGEPIVEDDHKITFLYTLGDGPCPKSFGINVARLAGLPDEVLSNAKRFSTEFEKEMSAEGAPSRGVLTSNAPLSKSSILEAVERGDWTELTLRWKQLNSYETV